jgi:carotenoid cleavage dioxygenase
VSEEVDAVDLAVTGSLPPELDGRLLRIGPNPVEAPDPDNYHWFTGDGMVHGVRLGDGRAQWYRNRFVRSAHVAEVLGETLPGGPTGGMGDTTNTHLISHAGRTLALVEGSALPNELTDDLDTVGRYDFEGTLDGTFSVHTKLHPATGELHAVTHFWEWDHVRHVVVGADGRVRRSEHVAVDDGPMIHDCSLTESSVLVYDLPVTFDLDVAMSGRFPYRWREGRAARVGVLPREGRRDEVVWCDVEPCYVYHPLNAWDADDGTIVIDLIRHSKMLASDQRGPNEGAALLERWTVDPATRSVRRQQLDDRSRRRRVAVELCVRPDDRPIRDHRRGRPGHGSRARGPDPAAGESAVRVPQLVRPDPLIRGAGQASAWVTGSSPIQTLNVFLSLICWMNRSCSGGSDAWVWGDLK